MGKLFGGLTTDNLTESEDRVGGGYEPFPSDIYAATIKLAYAGQSQGGAHNVTIHADINGRELRETIYITNRKGENFYVDKQDGKTKHPLPGFTTINDLCLFATETPLAEQETETKTVKLYDFDERKELPQPVECLTALHGAEVNLAVLRKIEDKRKQGDDGQYHPTGETRTVNEIDKVLHPETRRTVNEYIAGIEEDVFAQAWLDKNQGKDRNLAKGVSDGGPGQSGTGAPGGGASASPKKKLFG